MQQMVYVGRMGWENIEEAEGAYNNWIADSFGYPNWCTWVLPNLSLRYQTPQAKDVLTFALSLDDWQRFYMRKRW